MSICNEYSLRPADDEWTVRFNDDVIATFTDRVRGERLVRDLAQHLADLIRQPVRLVLEHARDAAEEMVEPGGMAGIFATRDSSVSALH